MGRALGMVEYKTVSTGVLAADLVLKTADVKIVEAQTVCPGKYIVVFEGDLSAVRASVDAAKTRYPEQLIDSFLLGNPHDGIFPAIYGTADIKNRNALGVLETFDAAAIFVAADEAAKTAEVDLIEIRVARGMCGKSYVFLTGEVAAVSAAIAKAEAAVSERGMYLDSSVIASPDAQLWDTIL
ncbi:BMC domain-containing protein [Lachnospiraceae bacterium 47-T17]